ncbi:MAG: zinc-binding alcohol dehydrogenase family protein [Akkermansiaceae bacterium]|jgi:NADPH2:quinone reductase|nr:zinc-binding alcohol dehydrogenase family protein [Akkermansiaceae bacterium]
MKVPETMKAVVFRAGVALDDPKAAEWAELPVVPPGGYDVLVQVAAVAMNPVDTKVRGTREAVLGFDAAGTVLAVGPEVMGVSPGDEVYYAGSISRQGSNATYQLVDSRILARAPRGIGPAAAAALPLTTLTAWESLFDRLGIDPEGADSGRSLLVIGGAGGVGSIAIQLAKIAGLRVIATASRPESSEWCRSLGADAVVDHHGDLLVQMAAAGFPQVDFIANFNRTDEYWKLMGDLIAPQGKLVLIVEPTGDLPLGGEYKRKSAVIAWEFMFTRPLFGTEDLARQGEILARMSEWVEAGKIRSTFAENLGPICPENLVEGHRRILSGRTVGKLVLEGWD